MVVADISDIVLRMCSYTFVLVLIVYTLVLMMLMLLILHILKVHPSIKLLVLLMSIVVQMV